jgi:membrane-associated phospholipid phosphatase
MYTTPWRWLHVVAWVNCGLTAVATLYFGWHYVFDDIAGVAIALVAFYVGGLVSNQSFRRHPATAEDRSAEVTTV